MCAAKPSARARERDVECCQRARQLRGEVSVRSKAQHAPRSETQFKLSGGAIRSCSLAAAFRAADRDEEIAMRHLVQAVAQEYAKQGRLTLEADFARFHELVRAPANGWDGRNGRNARNGRKDRQTSDV
jgi:hypothetical protein